jgi:hypothetical protein
MSNKLQQHLNELAISVSIALNKFQSDTENKHCPTLDFECDSFQRLDQASKTYLIGTVTAAVNLEQSCSAAMGKQS